MKLLIAFAVIFSTQAFATSQLDGKTFCRTVESDGMFGQPKGNRQHCVRFENGYLIDNASTFFGNPPKRTSYRLIDGHVVVSNHTNKKGYERLYQYKNGALINRAGAVLTAVKNKARE